MSSARSTDGQELLSKKLRDVRDAYADPLAALDQFRYPVSDTAGPLSPAGREITPPGAGTENVETRSSFESVTDHVPLSGPLPDSAAETTQLVSLIDPVATLGDSVTQSNSTSATTEQPRPVTPAHYGSDDGQQLQPLPSSSQADGTTTAPANRDYNFFDELDARSRSTCATRPTEPISGSEPRSLQLTRDSCVCRLRRLFSSLSSRNSRTSHHSSGTL